LTTWRALRSQVAQQLPEHEARFVVECASGYDADEWLDAAEVDAPARAEARLWQMVERRRAGEPLQYVLGGWGFRSLDLMVDARVLIPRPETEWVVEIALAEARRFDVPVRIADLGTGSGAIALALAAELPGAQIWATDVSEDALHVARANVAGSAAMRVRVAQGSWFDAFPSELRGTLHVIVSNPPYVADDEVLPEEVSAYEPHGALFAGPRGTEAVEVLLQGAREWLVTGGSIVIELAPHQAEPMANLARSLGYAEVFVHDDLAHRARVLVARAG
jgi:release factor glutamine methyltransferase